MKETPGPRNRHKETKKGTDVYRDIERQRQSERSRLTEREDERALGVTDTTQILHSTRSAPPTPATPHPIVMLKQKTSMEFHIFQMTMVTC